MPAAASASLWIGAVTTAQAAPVGSDDGTQPIVMTDLRMGQTPWFVFSFVVAELGATSVKDMGKVMAELKARHGSELDMSKASALVKAALA